MQITRAIFNTIFLPVNHIGIESVQEIHLFLSRFAYSKGMSSTPANNVSKFKR